MGLPEEDFNSYATHRGDHLTAQRATFANPTLFNEMAVVDGKVKKGSLARIEPEGKVMRMWEAIETYMERKQPLIIIAGADYGQGSSRDWAAKGVRLAGVEAIVAEGFERIHRTNLIGMGVLPLEFKPGVNRMTLGIDGTETYDVVGERTPRADADAGRSIARTARRVEVPVTCRLDTAEEVSIYEAGGVLQRFAQDFLESVEARPDDFRRDTDVTASWPTLRRSGFPPPTCAAAPARACSSACRTCPSARRCRARRAMRCCCA